MHDDDMTSDINEDKQSSTKLIIIRKQDEAFVSICMGYDVLNHNCGCLK